MRAPPESGRCQSLHGEARVVAGIRTLIAMARLGLGQRPRVAMGRRPRPGAEGPRRAATWRSPIESLPFWPPTSGCQRSACAACARPGPGVAGPSPSLPPRTASLRPAGPGPGRPFRPQSVAPHSRHCGPANTGIVIGTPGVPTAKAVSRLPAAHRGSSAPSHPLPKALQRPIFASSLLPAGPH